MTRLRTSAAAFLAFAFLTGCGPGSAPALKEVQRAQAGTIVVVLLSEGDALKRGKGDFVLEFRDAGGKLVDVGNVTISGSMPMPGMAPMFADNTVMPSETRGRYHVASDFGMAGTWRLQITWNGPAGNGTVSMPGTVL